MRRHCALLLLLLAAAPVHAAAVLPELADRVAAQRPYGCADYRVLLVRLYRAELWTDDAPSALRRFALALTYQRRFTRAQLIDSSIAEMARMSGRAQEEFGVARQELEQAFRTVRKGDRYTAWRSAPGRVEFFLNGRARGALSRDGDLFLDIWLGPESRDTRRGARLLAGRCGR